MDPLRTSELRCFIAVAEELHFGRSATRLGVTQPQLSRTIKAIEDQLGVRLLERTSRMVRLTPAGEVLLDEGRRALDAMANAAVRAQRAGTGERRLTVSMKPGGDGGLLPDILSAYESHPRSVPVDFVMCAARERIATLRSGAADIALLHASSELPEFDTVDLLTERQVVVLPRNHRLAARTSVCMADLECEPRPGRPSASRSQRASYFHDASQLAQLIALGQAIAVAPESVGRYVRPDITCVVIRDAPLTTLMLAWLPQRRDQELAAFVWAATQVAGQRGPVVDQHP